MKKKESFIEREGSVFKKIGKNGLNIKVNPRFCAECGCIMRFGNNDLCEECNPKISYRKEYPTNSFQSIEENDILD